MQHQDVLPGSCRLAAGGRHVGCNAGQAAEAGVVLGGVHQVEGGVGGLDAAPGVGQGVGARGGVASMSWYQRVLMLRCA